MSKSRFSAVGSLFSDSLLASNDRIIGGMTHSCAEAAIKLYKKFIKGDCLTTTARTAELSKLTENAFRDINSPWSATSSGLMFGS